MRGWSPSTRPKATSEGGELGISAPAPCLGDRMPTLSLAATGALPGSTRLSSLSEALTGDSGMNSAMAARVSSNSLSTGSSGMSTCSGASRTR